MGIVYKLDNLPPWSVNKLKTTSGYHNPPYVFERTLGDKTWECVSSDSIKKTYDNIGSLMWEWGQCDGLEAVEPEKTPEEKAIAYFKTHGTSRHVIEYNYDAPRHAKVLIDKALADAAD